MQKPKDRWLAATVALLLLLTAMVWSLIDLPRLSWLVPGVARESEQSSQVNFFMTLACWLVFGLAVFCLRRALAQPGPQAHSTGRLRTVTGVVLIGSLLLGAAALSAPPSTSNDSARYAWDGIVQKAGISPYDHVPSDPALQDLWPEWLFQAPLPDGSCDKANFPAIPDKSNGVCFALNRPNVPTIYPPTSEIYFFLVRLPLPADVGFIGFQAAGLLLALGVSIGLLRLSRRAALPLDRVAWWAWSPLVIIEGVNNAHVDLLGAGLLLLAVILLAKGRVTGSAIAFGAAVAAKLVPVIAAPGMLYRKPWRFILVSISTFLVLYLPYVLISGFGVLGFLPGYLSEEGYDSSQKTSRFALLTLFLPQQLAVLVGGLIILGTAILVWRRTNPDRPWDSQVLFVSVVLLVVSPTYVWYALLLLPLIVLSGRYEYFGVVLALTVLFLSTPLPGSIATARWALAGACVLLLAVWLWRRQRPGALDPGSLLVPTLARSSTTT